MPSCECACGAKFRFDLLLEAIWRNLDHYLLTAFIFVGATAGQIGIALLVSNVLTGPVGAFPSATSLLLGHAVVVGVGIHLELVALRAVGVFCYYHRHGLGWEAE